MHLPFLKLFEGHRDAREIVIRCSDQAAEELLPLLRELKHLGDVGASRSIKIEDWDGKTNFGFDGDGSSGIDNITVDGEKDDGEPGERK